MMQLKGERTRGTGNGGQPCQLYPANRGASNAHMRTSIAKNVLMDGHLMAEYEGRETRTRRNYEDFEDRNLATVRG